MKTPASLLPDPRTLAARLSAALADPGSPTGDVNILERRLPRLMSTYPNEAVTCRLPGGAVRRLFIKYEGERGHDSYGHRGNVAYEAEVYRRVLHALPAFRPRCLGVHTDRATGDTWMILEYLDRCTRVSDVILRRTTRQPRAMVQAARWIGRFHATSRRPAANGERTFLIRYDADYFRGWASRTAAFAAPLRGSLPWLGEVCERTEEWSGPLLGAHPTVIHGEFYTKNLLLRRGTILVVDWESAAIAAGEIDLAALVEGGWPKRTVRRCERAYVRARWPEGAPADFGRRLDAAKIYLHLRWLGNRPDRTMSDKMRWRFDDLRQLALRMKLIRG